MTHRALLPLALVLCLAVAAAGVTVHQGIAVTPASTTPPATLAAGSSGSTGLGTSATSASTSVNLPLFGSAQVLLVQPGAGDWDIHMEVLSSSGFGILDSATVTLGGTKQAEVLLGSLVQDVGLPVLLEATDPSLQVRASGSVAGTGTLVMEIVLVPSGGTNPELRYAYTLSMS